MAAFPPPAAPGISAGLAGSRVQAGKTPRQTRIPTLQKQNVPDLPESSVVQELGPNERLKLGRPPCPTLPSPSLPPKRLAARAMRLASQSSRFKPR
ncbi:MAG: hypothetical protein LBQ12_03250 [Deltaproteobacteria bacterium]|nr:hypothetical protein [Deltaproteobacteria bacterium]